MKYLLLSFFAMCALFCFSQTDVSAATLTVNTTIDEIDFTANSTCSYREAMSSFTQQGDFGGCVSAGVYGTSDLLTIPAGTYTLTNGNYEVFLGGAYPIGIFGLYYLPNVSTPITVNGDPSGGTIIEQTQPGLNNLFVYSFDATINNITFRGGTGGIYVANGGFVVGQGTTLNNVTIENAGVGLYRSSNPVYTVSRITINNSLIQNNQSGIYNFECAPSFELIPSLYINNSVIKNNVNISSQWKAGGIYSCGHTEIKNSEISGNSGALYGGVYLTGNTPDTISVIENTTIANNTGTGASGSVGGLGIQETNTFVDVNGGGITYILNSNVRLTNNTIAFNTASGISDFFTQAPTLVAQNNLIVASNPSLLTCQLLVSTLPQTVTNQNNISNSSSCSGFLSNTFPSSGISPALATNTNTRASVGSGSIGGKAQTLALTAGSSALNIGNNTTCSTTDQRDIARPQIGVCDVGAYELPGTANVFDPPSAFKTVSESGEKQIEWKMVWINDGNTTSELVNIEDPISVGLTYVPGSLVCVVNGASIQQLCTYDSANNKVLWNGFIAPDPGGTTEANTLNEVVITFKTNYVSGQSQFTNQAIAYWDENQDAIISNLDPNKLNNIPVTTDGNNAVVGKQITVFSKVLASTGFELSNLTNAGVIFVASAVILVWVIRRRRSR
jgi:Right handed beta helix region